MRQQRGHVYEFGPFRLDVAERRLLRSGEVVPLAPRVFDTLVVLGGQSGHVLEKSDLLETLWPGTFVEESSLAKNISLLRRALGGESSDKQYIETVAKRGYRFIADVREVREDAAEGGTEKGTGDGSPKRPAPVRVAAARRPAPSRKILFVVCCTALLAAPASLLLRERPGRAGTKGARSIAVLPFRPLGDDSVSVPGHGQPSTFAQERKTNPFVADAVLARN